MLRITISAALIALATCALAQTATPAPQTKGQSNIVVNPTEAECRTGWNAGLRWSKEQFDQFCSTISKSK